MAKNHPPVPPANRSPKGTGSDPQAKPGDLPEKPEPENLGQQGETANTEQNTETQGGHGHRTR